MNPIKKISLIIIVVTTIVACKKKKEDTMLLIRDCTATYLRVNNLDLPVMNPTELESIDSGATVVARYYFPKTKKVSIRYGDDCGVPHTFPRGEWIFVEEVK